MTTNAIQITQPGGTLADPGLIQPLFGLEDYDGTEFRLPRYSIVQTGQQMTEWDAKGGQFHNNITGENKDELDAIILSVKQNRWFGPDFDEATKLKAAGQEVPAWCKSSNGKTPDADSVQRQADVCKVCPRSKGVRNPDGSYEPPACTEIRKALLAETDGTIAMLTVRKGSVREVDNFIQPFFLRKTPTMSVRTTIRTVAKKDARNQWYVPTFKARFNEPVSPEEQAGLAEMAALYLPFVNRVSEDDTHGEEQGTNPAPAGGAPIINAEVLPPEPEVNTDVLNDPNLGF